MMKRWNRRDGAEERSSAPPLPEDGPAEIHSAEPLMETVTDNASRIITPPRDTASYSPLAMRIDSAATDLQRAPETKTDNGSNLWRSFLLMVIVPTIIMGVYLFFVATPQYVSEARVIVRTAQEDKTGDMSDALSFLSKMSGGPATKASIADAYIVSEYIRSRSIVHNIGGVDVLDSYFSKPTIDFFSRLALHQPIEIAWYYWQSMVSSSIDTQSSIISISARAFSPEDADRLLQTIIAACEAKLNALSQRARNDAIDRAAKERDAAAERLKTARSALLDFRSKNQSIDPVNDASQLSGVLAQLTMERIETENEMLVSAGSLNAASPTRRLLTTRLKAIDDQIDGIQQKLTGAKNSSAVSQRLGKYEELQLEIQFAERLYASSESAIDTARKQAERQQLYLAEVVSPTLPQFALYPKAGLLTFFTFLGGVAAWMLSMLIVAGIRDHMI